MAIPAKKNAVTQVNTWEKDLADAAVEAAAQEQGATGGTFFSLQSGQLSFDGDVFPNNEMAVIILDSIKENILYKRPYDKDSMAPPDCYAFGRDEKTICPHEDVESPEAELCASCPQNQWKSNPNGRGGKWCGNRRRLALINAGSFVNGQFQAADDPEHYQEAAIAYLKVSVMSVKAFAGYVKQVGSALARPPYGVFTKIRVVPDSDSQFRVVFECLGNVPNALMDIVIARHKEAEADIEFPYQPAHEPVVVAKAVVQPVVKRKSKF